MSIGRGVLIMFLSTIFIYVYGQDWRYVYEKQTWHPGVIYHASGENIEGLVSYNFVLDHVQVDQEGKLRTFIPNNIIGFALKDSLGKSHNFITLPYDSKANGRKVSTVFYVVHQNTHYVVLFKHMLDYYNFIPESNSYNEMGRMVSMPEDHDMEENIVEVIFLADRSKKIQCVLERRKAIGLLELDRYKLSDKKSFKTFFGKEYFRQFATYVDEHDLDLGFLSELLIAIDFREFKD